MDPLYLHACSLSFQQATGVAGEAAVMFAIDTILRF